MATPTPAACLKEAVARLATACVGGQVVRAVCIATSAEVEERRPSLLLHPHDNSTGFPPTTTTANSRLAGATRPLCAPQAVSGGDEGPGSRVAAHFSSTRYPPPPLLLFRPPPRPTCHHPTARVD